MNSLLKVFFIVFTAALTLAGGVSAEPINKIRVSLEVSTPDRIRAELISYLSRELRKMEDIEVVDRDSMFRIKVLALQIKSRAGDRAGYAFSVLVTNPIYSSMRSFVEPHVSASILEGLDFLGKKAERVEAHFIQLGAVDELEPLSRQLIATIDGDVFEPERKLQNRILDDLKHQSPASTPP